MSDAPFEPVPVTRLLPYERRVLDMLLAGEFDELRVLRAQFERCEIVDRKFTGHGFFTDFRVPSDVPRLQGRTNLTLEDVHADVRDLEGGAGFILFVREGVITFLEGFGFGDITWPDSPELLRVFYLRRSDTRPGTLVECSERSDWCFR